MSRAAHRSPPEAPFLPFVSEIIDADAVVFEDERLSYGELDARSTVR
jgi:hypothetical protein